MASDYGDEAGGKLLDWMLRIGQEAGAEAMARSARELSERLAGIRGTIAGGRAEAIAADGVPTYAKLSLEELSGLPEYATIKEVVSDKLRAASVEHHIIPGEGRDWLLFKVEDAPEVDIDGSVDATFRTTTWSRPSRRTNSARSACSRAMVCRGVSAAGSSRSASR